MDLGLKGKVALVCGASRGLGFAAARLLSMEGALVAINSRNSENINNAAASIQNLSGNRVCGFGGDISDASYPEQLVNEVVQTFGQLDILISNAGGPPAGSFENMDDLAWQKAFELSFMSNVRLIRAALPHLKKSASASVLTVTSLSSKQPIPNLILSNSIRAATNGLTKSLALELGASGIRFNAILPGWTETERVHELMTARANTNGTSVDEEIKRQSKESPLGRLATPEEFAASAVFLVSPVASYLTGVMLSVDGGMYKGTL
ncbi:MAG: SDR family oxidoreductase [Anaerolineae bacterium]|nr:SDR family oxidoreductase [Anaerolineae bacterium]